MSEFESRSVAKGTQVTVVIGNEERELKATKAKGGWAITPTDAAEAASLAQFSDEALDPAPPPEVEPGVEPEGEPPETGADDTPTEAPTSADDDEAEEGQEETP